MYSLVGGLVLGNSGGTVVHIIIPPMGLQTSSGPWVLSLAAPFGTLCPVSWLVVSHGYFDSPSNKDQSIHTLVFLLLEFHVVYELYSELLG